MSRPGLAWLYSPIPVESNNLGGAFQFEDRLGFGLRFNGGHEVGIRAMHYSNAGLASDNDGVESYATALHDATVSTIFNCLQ